MSETFWLFATQLTILSDENETESQYDLIDGTILPGVETPFHMHTKYSEAVYVLEGEITAYTNKAIAILKPGQSFFIPKGTPHLLASTGLVSARALAIASPSGFAKLIRTVGTSAPAESGGAPSAAIMEKFMRISAQLGDVILGPPGSRPAAE